MKPTLHVPGVDPARIVCETVSGWDRVRIDGVCVASIADDKAPAFGWNNACQCTLDGVAVMNAAIDHWRATGRLFPEPKVGPVACVCGHEAEVGVVQVYCHGSMCHLSANNITEWNTIQAALKEKK